MARIIQIGKRRWLAGMSWLAYEDSPSTAELKADAARKSAGWVAVRNAQDYKQAGFCAALEGETTRNLYSLAAKLAESKTQPWLGVYRLSEEGEEGLWWYIAVRDNHAILPDGDVVGSEDDIRAAQERHSGFLDWNHFEGKLEDLAAMLEEITEKSSPVKSLQGNSLARKIAAGVLVGVGAAGGGGWWWYQHRAEEQERLAAMARLRAQLQSPHQPTVPAPVVAAAPTYPSPSDWLQGCGYAVLDQPLSQSGWALEQASCKPGQAVLRWRRGDGATVEARPEGVVSDGGEVVTEVILLPAPAAADLGDMVDRQQAEMLLRGWVQSAGFSLKALGAATPSPAGQTAATRDGAPAAPAFTERTFDLDLSVSPFNLNFGSLPGLRLTSLESTATGWAVHGVLYGK